MSPVFGTVIRLALTYPWASATRDLSGGLNLALGTKSGMERDETSILLGNIHFSRITINI
jgi:hypothetical protein